MSSSGHGRRSGQWAPSVRSASVSGINLCPQTLPGRAKTRPSEGLSAHCLAAARGARAEAGADAADRCADGLAGERLLSPPCPQTPVGRDDMTNSVVCACRVGIGACSIRRVAASSRLCPDRKRRCKVRNYRSGKLRLPHRERCDTPNE
jgi:hypothetical protein